ncbi:hypothetical protein ILUMI_00004 [Ignelater luminosus]|uniref:DUF7869 domain-containing protein n=1 Tax=Ignelater luminosus TaxID=2038154 RepID=A0A8K0GNI4_IGNLU|nr:hypothetical protein ILUMI_00004 [Ignelater luminosus]
MSKFVRRQESAMFVTWPLLTTSLDTENGVNLQNNDNEVEPILQKGKTRMRNPERWVRNQRKVNRNSVKQYINSAGNVIPEKKQRPRCQCKGNCYELFTESQIAVSRASGNIVPKQDMRGKHSNRPNKLAADVVATVREHIESFPPRESYYSRNESQKKYLPAELTYDLLKKKEQTKPRITYDFYYRYFVEHFNLSFGFPRTDTCSTCDMINVQIESAPNRKEKQCILQRKELHLRKAQAFYDDLKAKTQLAETDPTVETLCFDYQQNLPVSLLTTGDIFYAQQLWVFNQAFHSCSDKKAEMYMFDETIGKKGCIETVSFLKHYIEKHLRKSVTILHIFTDNCGGQNKNAVVLHFFMSLVRNDTLSKIVYYLPEPGHSFLPCDRDFAQIEKKKRRKKLLYLLKSVDTKLKKHDNNIEIPSERRTYSMLTPVPIEHDRRDTGSSLYIGEPSTSNFQEDISSKNDTSDLDRSDIEDSTYISTANPHGNLKRDAEEDREGEKHNVRSITENSRKLTRKRIRDPSMWKSNIQKKTEEYLTQNGKLKCGRNVRDIDCVIINAHPTFDISIKTVKTAISKLTQSGTTKADSRGKKSPPKKKSDEVKEITRDHIKSSPIISLHYCRSTSKRKYFPSELSETRLYSDYKAYC